ISSIDRFIDMLFYGLKIIGDKTDGSGIGKLSFIDDKKTVVIGSRRGFRVFYISAVVVIAATRDRQQSSKKSQNKNFVKVTHIHKIKNLGLYKNCNGFRAFHSAEHFDRLCQTRF